MNSRQWTSILTLWDELAASAPTAAALIDAGEQRIFTRAEIDARAREWAKASGVSDFSIPPKRIGFASANGAAWLATFIGILRTGSIALPIDASEPASHQRVLAAGARADFWWDGEKLEPLRPQPKAKPLLQSVPSKNGDPLCLIKLTSGSTGRPRPLVFRDSQMIADGRAICATMEIRPQDINLGIIPFGHSYGLGNLVMPLLIQGTAILCVSAPLPHAIAENCARWKPTVFPAVPALLRLLTLSDLAPEQFASLRTVISAGSLLSGEVARAFFEKYHVRVHGFYGSSETGGICFDRSGEATLEGRSVGHPLEGVRLHFQRAQRFVVESPAVFTQGNRRGRIQKADTEIVSTFGCHRPADRGELNELGELRLLGRAGRMMKIAGRRIDLAEVESSVRKLAGIRDAFFTPHPHRTEELAGALATELDLESARSLLRKELAAWKVPKKLVVLSHFPLTGRGKTDTAALRKLLS